ncbi:MAG: M14 family metallopeptidase [Limnochordia bacterium]
MKSDSVSPFLTYDQLAEKAATWADAAPELIRVFPVTATAAGRSVLCVEIAAERAAKDVKRRPGFLITANMHAVELAGSRVCVDLIDHLIEVHSREADIGRLLRERVLYVIPRVAVDGAEYVLATLNRVRSVPPRRRVANRVYAQDIDGDGRILSMRVQDRRGNLKLSERDPRLLVPKGEDDTEGPFYRLFVEGLVHDWSGESFGDVAGDIDFNRNFPAGWQPVASTVSSGPYPLSEPETRGLAEFVCAHPHIWGALDLHTGNPAVFYPSATVEGGSAPKEDAALIARLAKEAGTATGFPVLSGYREITSGRPDTGLPGTFMNWLYEHRGIPALLIELGLFYNYLGIETARLKDAPAQHREETESALLAWHDAHEGSSLFTDWRPFDHPQFGRVEIGGWDYVLWSNPPPAELDGLSRRCAEVVLQHLAHMPVVSMEAAAGFLGADLYKVDLALKNVGTVPTCGTRQAMGIYVTPHLLVEAEADGPVEFVIGKPVTSASHLAPRQEQSLQWVLRVKEATTLRFSVSTERALFASAEIRLCGQ